MFRICDYGNNHMDGKFRNNSSCIIHEHDFVPIGLKSEESIICLTCGSFYSEKSGNLLRISSKKLLRN